MSYFQTRPTISSESTADQPMMLDIYIYICIESATVTIKTVVSLFSLGQCDRDLASLTRSVSSEFSAPAGHENKSLRAEQSSHPVQRTETDNQYAGPLNENPYHLFAYKLSSQINVVPLQSGL